DLRSPLTVIMGHAGILHRLMERNDPNPRYLQGIRAIESSSSQMNSMIQDLVDVTRLETGKLKLDRTAVDIEEFFKDLLEKLEGIMEVGRIGLAISTGVAPVDADPLRLERIVMNLLSNAFKYSQPEMPVRVKVTQSHDEVIVSISDQGAGIPPDQMPRLFEKFSGTTRTGEKAQKDSLGLGLYITKGLVEAHGGRIWVESTPGKGSTFTFTLPVVREADGEAA
ncbi:MAG TPA: ATP-binding protein, partial [Chloroflexota bacterium]